MSNEKNEFTRAEKKLTNDELMAWLDEMQVWAKSVGLTEQDIEDSIKAVRQRKRQTRRQSA